MIIFHLPPLPDYIFPAGRGFSFVDIKCFIMIK